MTGEAIAALRAHCNREIAMINSVGADGTPGFQRINALLISCDAVFRAHDEETGAGSRGVNREPPALDSTHRPSPPDTKEPWVTCPECGVGPGVDHLMICSRGK